MTEKFLNFLLCRGALRNVNSKWFSAFYSSERTKDFNKFYQAESIPEDIWDGKKDPKYSGYEEVKNCWHHVERLFPKLRIPDPPKQVSSTGWKAPSENVPDLPYFIERSRNHMLPVYQGRVYRDRVLVTKVCKVLGDIWVFEYDMKNYLEAKLNEEVESHVNEIACYVNFRGNHIDMVKEWLYNKGF